MQLSRTDTTTDTATAWKSHILWTLPESGRPIGIAITRRDAVYSTTAAYGLSALPAPSQQLRHEDERRLQQDHPTTTAATA